MFIALKWSGDIERTFEGHRKWGVQIGVDIHFNYLIKNFIGCVEIVCCFCYYYCGLTTDLPVIAWLEH